MTKEQATSGIVGGASGLRETEIAASSASRLLIIGGIGLIAAGMIFGDIFAVFVLHPNADRIGAALAAATEAVAAKDPAAVLAQFQSIGGFLENRGTKVDAHVHIIDFGYLALLFALIQPYVALAERTKRRLGILFLIGAVVLPVSVFFIHYAGLKYSPLHSIGWASILADLGGLLVIIASAGQFTGLLKRARGAPGVSARDSLSYDRSWASRTLLTGGTLLVLAGFLYGSFYAVVDLSRAEERDQVALETMINASVTQQKSASPNMRDAHLVVAGYGELQGEKAVKIAAHSHIIEFGLLAVMLGLSQQHVSLSERWRRRWVAVLLAGSVVLPVFVLLEMQMGLVAGGIADFGGLLVIAGLMGMLVGVLRFNGIPNSEIAELKNRGTTVPQRTLIISGLALAIWGMGFGLYYAVFVEHQTLEAIGGSLATGFALGAEGKLLESHEALQNYADIQFNYVRSVDVHSHWIGLAMLMIVLGAAFERVRLDTRNQQLAALGLLAGSVIFPMGVLAQTTSRGVLPQAIAAGGAALVIIALVSVAAGFARRER